MSALWRHPCSPRRTTRVILHECAISVVAYLGIIATQHVHTHHHHDLLSDLHLEALSVLLIRRERVAKGSRSLACGTQFINVFHIVRNGDVLRTIIIARIVSPICIRGVLPISLALITIIRLNLGAQGIEVAISIVSIKVHAPPTRSRLTPARWPCQSWRRRRWRRVRLRWRRRWRRWLWDPAAINELFTGPTKCLDSNILCRRPGRKGRDHEQ